MPKKNTSFYLALEKTNWITEQPKENKIYTAQIRYHGEFFPCKIICARPSLAQVVFEKPILVASGQSVVVYDGDVCLGGWSCCIVLRCNQTKSDQDF